MKAKTVSIFKIHRNNTTLVVAYNTLKPVIH